MDKDLDDKIVGASYDEGSEDYVDFDDVFSEGMYDDEEVIPEFVRISSEVDRALLGSNKGECSSVSLEGGNIDSSIDDKGITEGRDKASFNKKVLVVSLGALVALGVVFGCSMWGSGDTIEDLEDKVNRLYTTNRKDDLKSNVSEDKVAGYYTKAEEFGGIGGAELMDELDTISYYMADRDVLEVINDSSYDLNSVDLVPSINKVKESLKGYSVDSLASTISDIIGQVELDYSYYIELRDELSIVGNASELDLDELQRKVNRVTHSVNKKELQGLLNEKKANAKVNEVVSGVVDGVKEEVSEKVDSTKLDVEGLSDSFKDFFSSVFRWIGQLMGDSEEVEN